MSENVARLLSSPKTIRARLSYDSLPNVTIRSSHAFLTDKYNPVPVSPTSYTRAILADPPDGQKQSIDKTVADPLPQSSDDTPAPDAAATVDVVSVEELKSSFVQRKEEREQCSKDFTEFLSSSLVTSANQFNAVVEPLPEIVSKATPVRTTESDPARVAVTVKSIIQLPQPDCKVKSKTATLKLSPREKAVPNNPALKNLAIRTKQPPTLSHVRQKSNSDIPQLKIGTGSKASSITMDTDRSAPLTERDGQANTVTRTAHDSARARKFMVEQQKKRKLASKSVDVQAKISAEERKRRLAALQQQTRKIVQRNVHKHALPKTAGKAGMDTVELPKSTPDEAKDTQIGDTENTTQRPYIDTKSQNRRGPDRGAIHFAFPPGAEVVIDDPTEVPEATDTMPTADPTSGSNTNRRCGILRRTEAPPTDKHIQSPMNIHFDQLMAPGLVLTLPSISTLSDTLYADSPRASSRQRLPELDAHALQMPDVQLQTQAVRPVSERLKCNTSKKTAPPESAGKAAIDADPSAVNVPYWLRPSPMQVYPYNFIMAVRKKLELIANPMLTNVTCSKLKAPHSPLSKPVYFKKKPGAIGGYRKKLQQHERDESVEHRRQPKICADNAGASQRSVDILSESDALTNLSSMSLQLPPTNSRSNSLARSHDKQAKKYQRGKKPNPHHSDSDSQATLSISSTIFSQSSPDKKKVEPALSVSPLVEPLCTNAIADMHLVYNTTKSKPSNTGHPFVNYRRGAEVPQTRTQRTRDSRGPSSSNAPPTSAALDQSNIIDMLDSFNRSLSHAISVNKKLHDTLNRPAENSSSSSVAAEPVASSANTAVASGASQNAEYSSKFDSVTSGTSASTPCSTAKSNDRDSTSLLENESSIKSSVILPTISSSSQSIQSEQVPTELSQRSPSIGGSTGGGSTTTGTSSGHSTLIDTNHSMQSTGQINTDASSAMQASSVSSIRTQLNSDTVAEDTISSVARHFEQSFVAAPSDRSLDAFHMSVVLPSPASTDRVLTTDGCASVHSSTKHSVRSSTSSTVTVKSMLANKMPTMRASECHEDNKENISLNTNPMASAADGTYGKHNRSTDQIDPNQSIGSDIFAVFNQTDVEYSVMQTAHNGSHSTSTTTTVMSEANISYSTLGMYEQLLKTEEQKSIDLTALLKAREKALMDRTKGQIAWLELQKQKYQERGMTAQISAVKKKQRALLVRLERERVELAKSAKQTASADRPKHSAVLRLSQMQAPTVRRAASPQPPQRSQMNAKPAMRAIDFAADNNMEAMLQQRENSLRQRRAHVESLIRWHQRLDDEECAVAEMESQLMARTNNVLMRQPQLPPPPQMISSPSVRNLHHNLGHQQRQIKNIEHSLEVLHALPSDGGLRRSIGDTASASSAPVSEETEERVSVSGSKMNRLWRRLTGESGCKFIPDRRYHLSKSDIAGVYEEAKRFVLDQFGGVGGNGRMPVLDQTHMSTTSAATATVTAENVGHQHRAEMGGETSGHSAHHNTHHSIACDEFIVVPALNLNFTSTEEQSMTGSDADGAVDSMAAGFYFTDNVQPMQLSSSKSREWDAPVANSAHSSASSSAKTFGMQPAPGNPLRDSAFSVDSLNSSRPEISEAISLLEERNHCDAFVPTANECSAASDAVTLDSAADVEDAENTLFIGDISCPKLMENSATISEQLLANCSINQQLTSPLGTADNRSSATDNDHLPGSYSDCFEPETTAMITTTSDMIDEITDPVRTSVSQCGEPDAAGTTEIRFDRTNSVDLEDSSAGVSEHISTQATSAAEQSTASTSSQTSHIDSADETTTVESSASAHKSGIPDETIPTGLQNDEPVVLHAVALHSDVDTLVAAGASSTTYEMPDIISEAEVLRRQQMRIEEEIKQLEENAAAPFAYIREIPNKPPPPYVPPAHGSPMTAIFPSDARIRDIVYRRVEQLLAPHPTGVASDGERASTGTDENITNIYERIALDICVECLDDMQPDTGSPVGSGVATHHQQPQQPAHFKHPLAFYNPPDRLECMQLHVLRRVKKLLRYPHASSPNGSHASTPSTGVPVSPPNGGHAATDGSGAGQQSAEQSTNAADATPHSGHVRRLQVNGSGSGGAVGSGCGAKRKLWCNEILLHEMMEDDATWTNFDAERSEVLHTVSDEIVRMLVAEALVDCERSFRAKSGIGRNDQ